MRGHGVDKHLEGLLVVKTAGEVVPIIETGV